MDSFSIIQNFFTRMRCSDCNQLIEADGVELLREDSGVYIVSVFCHSCERQIGVAMVGVEVAGDGQAQAVPMFEDPELTEQELDRLADFEPVGYDDVLKAHDFIQNLDGNWMQFIPSEIRERYRGTGKE